MKKTFLLLTLLMSLLISAVAQAEPVEEFGFRIKDIKSDGRYTLDFSSRSYDTTGDQPPALSKYYMRVPAGIDFNKATLAEKYQCDAREMINALIMTRDEKVAFADRIANLKATLARARKIRDIDGPILKPKQVKNIETCIAGELGRGSVLVDVRSMFDDLIPVRIFVYVAKKTDPNAEVAFSVAAIPDAKAQVVIDNPIIGTVRADFTINIFREPTADGLHSYRIDFPTGRYSGIRISLAELKVSMKGITDVKTTTKCTKKARGKCVKKKVTKKETFWLTRPKCPASELLNFLVHYEYEGGLMGEKTAAIPCPKF